MYCDAGVGGSKGQKGGSRRSADTDVIEDLRGGWWSAGIFLGGGDCLRIQRYFLHALIHKPCNAWHCATSHTMPTFCIDGYFVFAYEMSETVPQVRLLSVDIRYGDEME